MTTTTKHQVQLRQGRRILTALIDLGGVASTRQITDTTPWSILTVHPLLAKLEAAGEVTHTGGRGGQCVWSIATRSRE